MKILHAADLHLGKVFHEVPLLEDQKCVLGQLLDELGQDDYAALVIAGDIYDRSVPPAEAVEAFSAFLAQVRHRAPNTAVFAIPGNHDSPARLSYVSEILCEQKVFITCNPKKAYLPKIISHNGETAAFFSLPFLFTGTLESPEDGMPLLSQEMLAKEAARQLQQALKALPQGLPAVLIAHLFTAGGESSTSERVIVGTAEKVNSSLFDGFAYVALGHLHKFQKVHERMYYSGSPLAYAFDEAGAQKCFIKAEIDTKVKDAPITVTKIAVKPRHRVTRLYGRFNDFFDGAKYTDYIEDYLEIDLADDVLQESPLQRLRERFPNLLSVRQNVLSAGEFSNLDAKAVEAANPIENFISFEGYIYPEQEESHLEEKKALFAAALEECRREERSQ